MVKKEIKKGRPKKKKESTSSDNFTSSESSSEVQAAVKAMSFRNKRGEKLQLLIKRNAMFENAEEENFWNNNKYFGENVKDADLDDNESFNIEENQKMDSYDSDFGREESPKAEEEQEDVQEERSSRPAPKKVFKKVHFHKSLDDLIVSKREYEDADVSSAKSEEGQKKYYIHEFFTQEQLLKEAVETEAKNRESLHNLIMIEEERKRIHLRQRHNIEGSYSKHVFRIAKEYGDFSDRPFTRIKSIVKVKQVEGYPRIELFAPQRQPIPGRGSKYRDPLTKQEFNTIDDFTKIRKQHQSKLLVKQQHQLQAVEALLQGF